MINLMRITIQKDKTIGELQKEFNDHFPYLRIMFFSKPHQVGKGTERKYMKDANVTLETCRIKNNGSPIEFDQSTTVVELEEKFAKEFDLFIQVFRRSGNLWLETTATDNWSLHHQNEQGRELSGSDWRTKDDVSDYHEQE
jgi:hypothetical protein